MEAETIIDSPAATWVRALIKVRGAAVCVGVLLFVISVRPAMTLQLDRSVASVFADDDPTLIDYQELRTTFGGNAIVLLVYEDPELMSAAGLQRNASITSAVRGISGIRSVLSSSWLNDALGIINPELLGAEEKLPPLVRNDPIAGQFRELFAGYTHADDGQSAAIVAMLGDEHNRGTIERLRELSQTLPEPITAAALVGEPVLVHDGFNMIARDGRLLATWAIPLLAFVLVLCVRLFRFVVLAGIVIAWSYTVSAATMSWLGIEYSLVSTMLLAVVAVITIAAVMHLGVQQRTLRQRGTRGIDAVTRVIATMGLPIAWACATDAAGFASLAASQLVPVQQFACMLSVSVIMILAGLCCFAPALMAVWDLKTTPAQGSSFLVRDLMRPIDRYVRRACQATALVAIRRRGWVIAFSIVTLFVSGFASTQVPVETSFLNNFQRGSPIVAAYDHVEQEFGGSGVWDVIIDVPAELTPEVFEQIVSLESQLRQIDVNGIGLTKVLSIVDAEMAARRIPLLALGTPEFRTSGMRVAMPAFCDALLSPPEDNQLRKLRIMLRSQEQLPAQQKMKLIERVRETVTQWAQSESWQTLTAERPSEQRDASRTTPRVTGYYVMMSQLVSRLVDDQWRCFVVASLAVLGLLWIATQSLRLALAASLPSLLPIFAVIAATGLWGGQLNLGTAMIAAVSIGLSIDGAVHYLVRYQRIRRRGHDQQIAAMGAIAGVGLPVVLATIALVIGFQVIATSEFVPTATFGQLVSYTMALGTLVNLTVLPAGGALGRSRVMPGACGKGVFFRHSSLNATCIM